MRSSEKINIIKPSKIREITALAPPGTISLGIGEIRLEKPELLEKTIMKAVSCSSAGYSPNQGFISLRQKISNYYENKIPPENICVTCGAQEALFTLCSALIDEKTKVLIADPSFLAYKPLIEFNKGTAQTFSLREENNFRPDFEEIEKILKKGIDFIILCNPSNPLSISFSENEMKKFSDLCEKYDCFIIADEVYRELYIESRPPSFNDFTERAFVISSFSKSMMLAGWRIGWFTVPDAEAEKFIRIHQFIVTCAPVISQKTAELLFSETGEKINAEIREKLGKNYKIINDFLRGKSDFIKITSSNAFPYLWCKVNQNDEDFVKKMLVQKLAFIPGSAFGRNGKNHIRICYALEKERLEKALQIMS